MPTIWPAPAPELCLPERSAPKSGSDKKAWLRQKKPGYGYINHNTVHERLQLHFYLVFLNEIVEKSFVCIFLPSLSLNAKKKKIVNFYAAARNIFFKVQILTPFWPVLWIRIRNFFLDPELFVLDQDPATLKEQLNKKKYF